MLVVSVCTVYSRLQEIDADSFPKSEAVSYFVSCQGKPEHSVEHYTRVIKDKFGNEARYSFEKGYGLSRNRNRCLEKILRCFDSNPYIYICDDDVKVRLDMLFRLMGLARNSGADFAIGKISTPDGWLKSYPPKPSAINRINAAKISSIEILVSASTLRASDIRFDERFGLGSTYPSGEEYIFCCDLLKYGAKGWFFPVEIGTHPSETSSKNFYENETLIMAKGAMSERVFGKPLSIIIALLFALKKYSQYRHKISLVSFARVMLRGLVSFE